MGLGHQGRVGTTLESMVASQRGGGVSVLSQQKIFRMGIVPQTLGCLSERTCGSRVALDFGLSEWYGIGIRKLSSDFKSRSDIVKVSLSNGKIHFRHAKLSSRGRSKIWWLTDKDVCSC